MARDQGRTAGMARIVENVAGLGPPRLERALAQPRARDRLAPVRGDDDVGIDVLRAPRIGVAGNLGDGLHPRDATTAGGVAGNGSSARAAEAAPPPTQAERQTVREGK